ncbi:hypothetical protein GCM10009116_08270 [Brevundimonas basaltis]|uniref:Uncharacterized protein n=1 Tax=Brevundimonas basaltis TaxID=472166 RepID=A0A7W8MHQ6_9CAUL|nr:hypothetical protein [Brevundimonas basaltis]MBB5292246.1 hypothetical protein [Brevundimonas basaltis]
MRLIALALSLTVLTVAAGPALAQEQMSDPDFAPTVSNPAYAGTGRRS